MHSSWFRKPVYKQIRWLAALFIGGSLALAFFDPAGWLYVVFFSLLWLTFSMICAFNIRSGAYVKTINSGRIDEKKIYLTFDDGPVEATLNILNILNKYQAKASFFVKGNQAEQNQEILRKISMSGHCIGNHSYSHKSWFPLLPVRKIKKEIERTQSLINRITGSMPAFFRPPFGVTNPLIANALQNFDLKVAGWNIRSLDTVSNNPGLIIDRIINQLKPGRIVLLHDTTPNIEKVLEALLLHCKKQGLTAVSLNDLL
jgi:peptidoglycan/xylan/chitin deacetylase (PgdA/CDA1 family)